MKPVMFYYVHHHGRGHITLFHRLRPALETYFDIHVLTHSEDHVRELKETSHTHLLPPKIDPTASGIQHTFSRAFEGVPYGKFPVQRAEKIASLVSKYRPVFFFSDGSAELVIMLRSYGIPVVYNHLLGNKDADPTQVFAYECADQLTAFFPEKVEHHTYRYKEKTLYLDLISDYGPSTTELEDTITILMGSDQSLQTFVPDILAHTTQRLQIVGHTEASLKDSRVTTTGFVQDLSSLPLGKIVITSAGLNSISDLLSLNKQIIAVPGARPYDEQRCNALQFEKAGWCIAFDGNSKWNDMIHQATQIGCTPGHNKNAPLKFAAAMRDTYVV